jgi:hypothetical protein
MIPLLVLVLVGLLPCGSAVQAEFVAVLQAFMHCTWAISRIERLMRAISNDTNYLTWLLMVCCTKTSSLPVSHGLMEYIFQLKKTLFTKKYKY